MTKISSLEQLQKWINWNHLVQQNPNDIFPNYGEETLEMYIHNLIHNIFQINPNCGLETYFNHIFNDSINIHSESPTKTIYPYIDAKRPTHAERSIRYNITSSWNKIPDEIKENVFPYLISDQAPSNSCYIVNLYEYINGHFCEFSKDELKQIKSLAEYQSFSVNQATIPKEYADFKLRFFIKKLMYEQYQDYNTFACIGAINIYDTILSYITGTAISDHILNQVKYVKYINGMLSQYPYPSTIDYDPIHSEKSFTKRILQRTPSHMKHQIFNCSSLTNVSYMEYYISNMVNYIQKVYHK